MGRIVFMTIACAAVLCTISFAKPTASQLAVGMVDSMAKGDFASATKDFDSAMKAAMSAEQLRQTWATVTAQAGAFKSRTGIREVHQGVYQSVYVTCRFEKTSFDIKVVITGGGQVTGLWFSPARAPAATYKTPSYVHTELFEEFPVFVNKGGEWQLPGTLTIPKGKGPFPALVLVHGSGPNDRDETIGPNRPFKDIAWGLASRGIAVLRYDKRTKVYGPKVAKIDTFTPKEEVTDDALAAVEVLRHSQRIASDKIFVLGHSLGGALLPRIGKANPKIAGLILMAGSARPFEDVILDQVTYLASLSKPMTDDTRKGIEKIKQQIAEVKSLKPSAKSSASHLLIGGPVSYWLDVRGYAPAKLAKSLKQPMLILQGGRDYQATSADFNIWKHALYSKTNVTFKFYPNLNHLFMTGKGMATPAEYEKPGTVTQSVINDMSDWIKRQRKSAISPITAHDY